MKGIHDSWAKITLSPKLGDLTSCHQFPFTVGTPGIYSKKPWICWSGGSWFGAVFAIFCHEQSRWTSMTSRLLDESMLSKCKFSYPKESPRTLQWKGEWTNFLQGCGMVLKKKGTGLMFGLQVVSGNPCLFFMIYPCISKVYNYVTAQERAPVPYIYISYTSLSV